MLYESYTRMLYEFHLWALLVIWKFHHELVLLMILMAVQWIAGKVSRELVTVSCNWTSWKLQTFDHIACILLWPEDLTYLVQAALRRSWLLMRYEHIALETWGWTQEVSTMMASKYWLCPSGMVAHPQDLCSTHFLGNWTWHFSGFCESWGDDAWTVAYSLSGPMQHTLSRDLNMAFWDCMYLKLNVMHFLVCTGWMLFTSKKFGNLRTVSRFPRVPRTWCT